jgi:hypothetical protein
MRRIKEQVMHEPQWINFAERRRALFEQQRMVQWRNRAMIQKRGLLLIFLAIVLFIVQQSHVLHMGLGISLRVVTLFVELFLLVLGLLLLLALMASRSLRLHSESAPKDVHPGFYDNEDAPEIF